MELTGGVLVSEGLAFAPVYVYKHADQAVQHTLIEKSSVEQEISRFEHALSSLIETSKAIKCTTKEEKNLVEVQIGLLSDPDMISRVSKLVRDKLYNASWAVDEVIEEYKSVLSSYNDEYFSERVSDLEDVRHKLVDKLSGESNAPILTEPSVLVSDFLLPSEMLSLDRSMLKGIVLSLGGRTSHVAILAKSIGIPAILALKGIIYSVKSGDYAIIDGLNNKVIINPDSDEIAKYNEMAKDFLKHEEILIDSSNLPAVTKDGKRITLLSNIEGERGAEEAISYGAEGVGLFRTEFLFLKQDLMLDEEEKARIYKSVVSKFKDIGPVTVRTMDLGGDKFPSDLGFMEDNPFLGNRSIRYAMEHKDLFKSQLISILKASLCGEVKMMFPFISGPDELQTVLDFLSTVKDECRKSDIPFDEKMKVGTMIEVPSAAICSDIIADMVDFMSVGTNDLIQYTVAVDRGNAKVAKLYNPLHPSVLRLLKLVVDNGKAKGKPVSICGEMAGSVEFLPLLIGFGYENLSMASHSILQVKNRIRELEYKECKAFADSVLMLKDQKSIRKALDEFNGKTRY